MGACLQAKGKKPPDARSVALALLIKMSIMAVASAAQVLVDRTPQTLRSNDQTGNTFVRLFRFRIFPRQRIREVRVDNESIPSMTDQISALTQPGDYNPVLIRRFEVGDVVKECIIGKERFNHLYPPCSLRTISTPAHIFVSLRLAAQRAVCESPQSGANASCSAGAWPRHIRTRRATSSTVSM